MTKKEEQFLNSLENAYEKLLNRVTETDVIELDTKLDLLMGIQEAASWRWRDLKSGE